ncbi:MAG: glycosyltransferase family 4 protein [Candidatus Rickettsiella isopodorum]|nr:glycosyltransferase family 4 protein [Candidatus Rickettsiella isopodorum]
MLVGQLRKNGYDVDVYCFNTKREKNVTENGNDYYFRGFPKIPFLNNIVAIFYLINKLSTYNIIHVYNMGLIPAAALTKGKNCKLVATINNPQGALTSTYLGYIPLVNKISNFLTTNAIKIFKHKVDIYIALTHAIKNLYVQHNYDSSKIEVIPNMFDPLFLRPAEGSRTKKDITLLYSGQLGDNKGIMDLIEAFVIINKKYHDVYLKIIGKGKHWNRIAIYLKKYNLKGRVTLTYKNYPEVRKEYFSSDILIHPAKWFEPFSRVWLEAMCANLLIVSTNNPSAMEILKENVIFYDPGDKNGLINAIEKAIILSKNKNRTFKELEKYSPNSIVKSIIQLYDQL